MSTIAAALRTPVSRIVLFILAMKAALLLYTGLAHGVLENESISELGQLLRLWMQWDSLHYLAVAEHGYTSEGERRFFIVFFPLFPLLIRVVSAVTADYHHAALVVSTVASVGAGVLLYRLTRLELGEQVAE
ncbi:MAG: mannosyltransferase family protein, partial [Gammaproteobacteria bacterium]